MKEANEACQNFSSQHKDSHGAISRMGKAIDRVRYLFFQDTILLYLCSYYIVCSVACDIFVKVPAVHILYVYMYAVCLCL